MDDEHIFTEMRPWLLARANDLVKGREADAQDLVQEVFLRVLKSPERIDQIQVPRAWLFTILKNVFRSWYQKRKKTEAILIRDLDGIEPVEELIQTAEIERLNVFRDHLMNSPTLLAYSNLLIAHESDSKMVAADLVSRPDSADAKLLKGLLRNPDYSSRLMQRIREKLGATFACTLMKVQL